ncbi:LacI family DNA-binding transcriptional regulator [Christensenella timonensis]|uniref:LacI family DNA-binding transcriptional regulator n=1 Tax=Christensenella timonensis TaxID=1816678 RepID=UPI0008379E8F|nr:LacI family DNA-binding transcriptional regulator [Christensenella timonensis]
MKENRGAVKKVKLQDVADRSGVSISTVSRVVNNSYEVPRETRKRVNEAIRELGYVAKPKNDKKGSPLNGSIALMLPDIKNPFFQDLTYSIEKLLAKSGYAMILSIFENNIQTIEEYCREMVARKVDGCICICMQPAGGNSWFYKMTRAIPTVCFQCDVEGLDSIMTTDGDGVFEMVDHLIKLGHRRIGFIGYSWNLSLFERRLEAYRRAHEVNGIPVEKELLGLSEANLKSGYDQACRLLSLPQRPTAIHCLNTYTAMGVYTAIRDNKLRIPEDISLSGFDEAPVTQIFTPPLAVVAQPTQSIATTAMRMLLERMKEGIDMPPQVVTFPTTVILRQSVGPCPEGQPCKEE